MLFLQVDISEQVGNDIQHESNVEESCEHVHSTPDNVQVVQYLLDNFKIDAFVSLYNVVFHKLQQKHLISYIPAKNGCHKPSVPHEHMIAKVTYANLTMLTICIFYIIYIIKLAFNCSNQALEALLEGLKLVRDTWNQLWHMTMELIRYTN